MNQPHDSITPQKNKKHIYLSLGLAILAVIFIALLGKGLTIDQKKIPVAQLNKPAQELHVRLIQGGLDGKGEVQFDQETLTISELKGRPVILNFWASWCVSCREEALELEAFWKLHRDEILVVGVAIQDEAASARAFAEHYGKTYILALDEDGKAAIDYGVTGVPETFLIDRQGVIQHKEVGPVTKAILERHLGKIL